MTEEEITANLLIKEHLINQLFNTGKLNDKECLELILSYTIKSEEEIKALTTNLLKKYNNLPSILITPAECLINEDGLSIDTATLFNLMHASILKITWEHLR